MLTKSNIENKKKNTNNRFLGMNSGAKISSQRYISILHMRYLSDSGVFSAQLSVPFVCRLQSKAVKSY